MGDRVHRYYASRISWVAGWRWGIYARANRGGDRLVLLAVSSVKAERVVRLLNNDENEATDG